MLLRILLFLSISFFVSATEYGNATVSEVRSVYDGDSFRADIDDLPAIDPTSDLMVATFFHADLSR